MSAWEPVGAAGRAGAGGVLGSWGLVVGDRVRMQEASGSGKDVKRFK